MVVLWLYSDVAIHRFQDNPHRPLPHFVFLYNEFARQLFCNPADALSKDWRQYVCYGHRSAHLF